MPSHRTQAPCNGRWKSTDIFKQHALSILVHIKYDIIVLPHLELNIYFVPLKPNTSCYLKLKEKETLVSIFKGKISETLAR